MYFEWTVITIAIIAGLIAVIPTIIALTHRSMSYNNIKNSLIPYREISNLEIEDIDEIISKIEEIKQQKLNPTHSNEAS